MKKFRKDDQELALFRELYKTNAPMLIFYAGKYVDMSMAEDLVQDVFLKIWQKRALLFLKEGMKTYLYRSVQHACLDYLKHQEVENCYMDSIITKIKIQEIYYNDNPKSIFQEDERLTQIYKEMDKLPEKCRTIFMMCYLEERKTSEIAALLNISTRTVEAQLYKALKTLRSMLLTGIIILLKFF
ncbi:RNA polymerase sigma-70 factor [Parabacteroides faecis]|uniref:RNA polymerase sigma-70 factor n=1 Tax=Parabacteroides faecis TaxID=1217282 RepID=UPI0021645318|nr:RNA polymerase sigma-70 factor [Parabacteroides faecis]MCS2890527.1 RNA polymerase sigma-70 factor [Parabacteroides faecis]UVQ45800.1 RNA polymerase sigma-70 factor [Parabacteroides faecis]